MIYSIKNNIRMFFGMLCRLPRAIMWEFRMDRHWRRWEKAARSLR